MERSSAACGMEWSIELEEALRSKKPGRSIEAISETSARLQRLSREPEPSPAVHHLFDLIPGEDKLFLNAIILRLAHAFECGDKHIRLCIVKAFLFEYRKGNKGKKYNRVLSKTRVYMQPELLRMVKLVFDSGDVEDRALALGLFSCWAHFAKESSSARYLVLSSLVSSHIMEVKASLFAAGCFSELSEDFACVVLQMLPRMMTSPETSPAIRLAGARVFTKLGRSHALANNAYKTCQKLARLQCWFLSPNWLPGQPFLYLSSQEKPLHLRATAIRSLQFIYSQGMCHFPVNVLQSSKLLSIVENATSSPITSEGLLAFSVLVDVSRKLKGSTEMGSLAPHSSLLPSHVTSLIIDRITLMVKPVLDLCQTESPVFQQVNCLLNLLFFLIQEYPDLHVLVLDQIFFLVKSLSYMHDNLVITSEANAFVRDNVDFKGEKGRIIRSKLLFIVYRFLVAILENLSEAPPKYLTK